MDFTFPLLPEPQGEATLNKAPLTARSTVQHAAGTASSSGGQHQASMPAPLKTSSTTSNLEHRNKGDPLLTRWLYGLLARLTNVPLEKGYSQVDWMRLSRSTQPPALRKDITMTEVRQHRTREDAWMVFRNKVYNISPYLRFHPGGADILMKAAGKDGTSLFMKHHPWVNIDALMEKCLLGWLAADDSHQQHVSQSAPQLASLREQEEDAASQASGSGMQEDRQ